MQSQSIPSLKLCTRCRTPKALSDFNKNQPHCRACQSERFREWRLKNLEHRSAYWQQWHDAHRDERREYARGRYQRDPHVSARRLIQTRVQKGMIPPASSLSCYDCGERAADYDHYAGYEGEARAMVQAVCKNCHRRREQERRAAA
jgi:hypothetical protein